jgi:hypothetical protein
MNNFTKLLNIAFLPVFTLTIISGLSVGVNAESPKNTFTNTEVQNIQKLANIKGLNLRKKSIESELKSSKSKQYKDFISSQIAVDQTKNTVLNTNLPSKYSSAKNYICWDSTTSVTSRAIGGNDLFRFNLRTNTCADSSKVYSGSIRSTWADIYGIGWSYYGVTSDRNFAYINNNSTEYIASRQGLFKLCINNNWVCAQELRPWVEKHLTR